MRHSVLAALFVCALAAQQPSPNIRANARLVLVPATVTSLKGQFIDGLSADDFVLTDDGVRQKIRLDTPDAASTPMSLIVAVQSTVYSAAALAKIRRVGSIVEPLIAGDGGSVAVVGFDEEVRVIQDFTHDTSDIKAAFERVAPHSTKRGILVDAIATCAQMLSTRSQNSRRVLITISESRDRGSKAKLPAVLEQVQRAGIVVYPITYSVHATPWTARPGDYPPPEGGFDWIAAITELSRLGKINAADAFALATGGSHLSFLTLSTLEKTLMRAGEELHRQCLLSFVPAETRNTGYHRIEVTLASHKDAHVRARPGYWPEP
jgi:VWFA-related protein